MDLLDLIQWPAMVVTVAAAWLTGSTEKRRRHIGFYLFLLSNALWVTWGVPQAAWALVVLQLALAVMNVRGVKKQDPEAAS